MVGLVEHMSLSCVELAYYREVIKMFYSLFLGLMFVLALVVTYWGIENEKSIFTACAGLVAGFLFYMFINSTTLVS